MFKIFEKYQGLKPGSTGTMLSVPGDFRAETELDVSELSTAERRQLTRELQTQGLTVEIDKDTLKVSGPVVFEFSRGTDNQGRKAIWLSASGSVVELLSQSLSYVYTSKGWQLSTGRILREALSRVGGEIRLPDGTVIFLGSTEEYNSSLLSSDGSWVHPKLSLSSLSTADVVDSDEDPFK